MSVHSVCVDAQNDTHDEDPAWDKLLSWLQSKGMKGNLLVHSRRISGAGRGLFTNTDILPNTPLFAVPESAHINIKTLAPLYGLVVTALTATQISSLHIFLHRPSHREEYTSKDPSFGPYISILPMNFKEHPLSWMIASQEDSQDTKFLLDSLPPAAKRALKAMADRFWEDWKVVSQLLRENPKIAMSTRPTDLSLSPFISEDHIQIYLWAWLNVNTRCVYHRICVSASDPNNLTLCPLLDLANHTSLSAYTPSSSPIPTFFSPQSHILRKGEEVYLRYGPHSNVTLFTEYGFVERNSNNGGQADVQDILETLFQQKGDIGKWMKATLQSTNYWGDWTLHDAPAPAHPSYRLLPALRLMQLSVTLSSDPTSKDSTIESPELEVWHETLLGGTDIVSPENEERVWEQLLAICGIAAVRAEEGLGRLERECQARKLSGWRDYAADAIKSLWLEEQGVACAVMQSIKNGETIN